MLKLVLSLLLVFLITSVSFAGGMSQRKEILPVTPYQDPLIEKPAPEVHYIREVAKKPTPKKGLAIGFTENMTILSYSEPRGTTIDIGYTNMAGDQVGLVKGAYSIWSSEDLYQSVNVGMSVLVDAPINTAGLFIGLEQYISENVSITGDLYPLMFIGNDLGFGAATLTGRVYL